MIKLKKWLEALKLASRTHRPFTISGFQQRIEKPWGEEVIYTPKHAEMTGKVMTVKAGSRLSFQYHEQKQETMTLFSGRALLWIENDAGDIEKLPMEHLHGYIVQPGQKHRIEALEDCVVLEASTPELGSTVRIDDDYGRREETDEIRKSPNRGWKKN